MAPQLWSFARSQAEQDLADIRRCMPEAARPIAWEDEASCTSHSIVNMMENCAMATRKPSLAARLRSAVGGPRVRGRAGTGKAISRSVAFSPTVAEIQTDQDEDDSWVSAGPDLGTFLSAIPRPSSMCLLHEVTEDECEGEAKEGCDEGDGDYSASDSVLSACGTETRCSRHDVHFGEWSFEDESARTSHTSSPVICSRLPTLDVGVFK